MYVCIYIYIYNLYIVLHIVYFWTLQIQRDRGVAEPEGPFGTPAAYELQPIFLTKFNGHGFLIRDGALQAPQDLYGLGFRGLMVLGLCELQSVLPTQFHGHGFLTKDYIRDSTKLQEGPLCPLLRAP